ncbi:hypothetical protein C8F01DRAFT_1258377 [Mycena amicta]|nr:hypothetical protein C8F01DRAFT_1258377 [Mycena amicta]
MDNLDFLLVDEEDFDPPESDDDGDARVNAKSTDGPQRRSIHRANTARLWGQLAEEDILPAVLDVLGFLKTSKIDLVIFLDALLWGDQHCISDATCRYARTALVASECFPSILERCYHPPRASGAKPEGGRSVLTKFALYCVEELVDEEMEASASLFLSPRKDFKVENLLAVDFSALKAEVQLKAPTIWRVLRTAAYTPEQVKRNKRKNPDMVVLHMISQAQYTRSNRRARIPKVWSMYLKACGVPARAFDALHAVGLLMSHKWTVEAVKALSNEAMELIRQFIHLFPWAVSHDNVNIAMHVFSQRLAHLSNFISGCASTVFLFPSRAALPQNANRDLQIFRAANSIKVFDYDDVLYGSSAADARLQALDEYHVLRLLLDSPAFSDYMHLDDSAFHAPPPTLPLKGGPENAVQMYLLPTSQLEEASYEGTSNVMEDIFKQLELNTKPEQEKTATERIIPWIGDQLTIERLRGMWKFRHEDHNSFDRLNYMIPVFGWFHLVMALANSLHKQYLCTSGVTGSLRQAFDLLKRKGLITASTKGPFWHHLDEALHHIGEAHLRTCWLEVGKVDRLEDLKSKSPIELCAMAATLVRKCASREALNEVDLLPQDQCDTVFREWTMFNIDVLPYFHLRRDIQSGDVGVMEDLLPTLLFRFAGGRNPKYTIEILELLQGLKREWPGFLKDHIREFAWVVSRTGAPNSYLPFDLAQEENICDIKVNFRTHSPNTTFDYIGSILPAIPSLRKIQRHMEKEFHTLARGSRHTVPNKDADVEMLSSHYHTAKLHKIMPGRAIKHKAIPDVVSDGSVALESGTIDGWFKRRTYKRAVREEWKEDEINSILPEEILARHGEPIEID